MTTGQCKGQITLPQALADYLQGLVRDELSAHALAGAFVECALEGDTLNGRPVQRIVFFGKEHVVFGLAPITARLLIYVDRDGCTLYAA